MVVFRHPQLQCGEKTKANCVRCPPTNSLSRTHKQADEKTKKKRNENKTTKRNAKRKTPTAHRRQPPALSLPHPRARVLPLPQATITSQSPKRSNCWQQLNEVKEEEDEESRCRRCWSPAQKSIFFAHFRTCFAYEEREKSRRVKRISAKEKT